MVAGTGPLHDDFKRSYPTATFLGHIEGGRLQQIYQGASLLVVPSEWYENAPFVGARGHGLREAYHRQPNWRAS